VLLVHHTRKQLAEDFINTVSGTNGLTGACDTILLLNRTRQSSEATLEITSRDAPENKLAFTREGLCWKLLGDAEIFDISDTRRRIIKIIETENGITPKKLSDRYSDIKYDNAKQTLRRMAKDGQIIDVGGMYYPMGTQVIDFS